MVDQLPIDTTRFEDLHIVRKLRETIRKWWSIELAYADAAGFVASHKKGIVVPPKNPICAGCLAQKEGFSRCNRSVERGVKSVSGSKRMQAELCDPCHMGINVIATPVVLDERFYGAIFACGFLIEEEKEAARKKVIESAKSLGLPADDAAFDSIATIARRDLTYFKDLLSATAEEIVEVATAVREKEKRIRQLSQELGGRYQFGNIVGKSAAMQRLFSVLERVVNSDSTVLITGENGTGKELIARALHYNGPRKDRAFVAQNVTALNDNLLESELFGHVKGSFTGAVRDKPGLFRIAHGGTFFLDEVGDMSPAMQVKLLRVLQEGTFIPVGATKPEEVDVRVIAATHRDLKAMVERREFREDLYYRLNVLNIEVPALRARLDDLPILCDHFLKKNADRTQKPLKRLAPEVLKAFYEYSWPGNIRELENEIERLVVLAGDRETIGPDLLRATMSAPGERAAARFRDKGDLASATAALEREMIEQGLIATHWNKTKLAERLGVSRTTLIKKIKEYGIEDRG